MSIILFSSFFMFLPLSRLQIPGPANTPPGTAKEHTSVLLSSSIIPTAAGSALNTADYNTLYKGFLDKGIHHHNRQHRDYGNGHTYTYAGNGAHLQIHTLQLLGRGLEELDIVQHIGKHILNAIQVRAFYQIV